MSGFFASGGQSIEASALASVFPMNIQGWFPLGSISLTSCSTRDSQETLIINNECLIWLNYMSIYLSTQPVVQWPVT